MDPRVTEAELSRLAMKMSTDNVKELAQSYLNISQAAIDTMVSSHREDQHGLKIHILISWSNRNSTNSRKRLAKILYEAAKEDNLLNVRDIETIFHVREEDVQD